MDVIFIFFQVVLQLILAAFLEEKQVIMGNLSNYVFWSFWYVVAYIPFAYLLLCFIKDPAIFLFVFFNLNGFILELYFNIFSFSKLSFAPTLAKFYFPATLYMLLETLDT